MFEGGDEGQRTPEHLLALLEDPNDVLLSWRDIGGGYIVYLWNDDRREYGLLLCAGCYTRERDDYQMVSKYVVEKRLQVYIREWCDNDSLADSLIQFAYADYNIGAARAKMRTERAEYEEAARRQKEAAELVLRTPEEQARRKEEADRHWIETLAHTGEGDAWRAYGLPRQNYDDDT